MTEEQYEKLLKRVTALEEMVNTINSSLSQFVTANQVNQLIVQTQEDIESLKLDIQAIERDINNLTP